MATSGEDSKWHNVRSEFQFGNEARAMLLCCRSWQHGRLADSAALDYKTIWQRAATGNREMKLPERPAEQANANGYFGAKLRSNGSVTPGFFRSRRPPMRLVLASLMVLCVLTPAPAQEIKDGPTNEKAQ